MSEVKHRASPFITITIDEDELVSINGNILITKDEVDNEELWESLGLQVSLPAEEVKLLVRDKWALWKRGRQLSSNTDKKRAAVDLARNSLFQP